MQPSLAVVLCLASVARPDAMIVTRAMTASTIAEVFVEEERVRVEIEIGVADLGAFANVLPDEIRERMGLAAEPLEERLKRFFAEDLTISVETAAIRSPRIATSLTASTLFLGSMTCPPVRSRSYCGS